MIQRAVAPRFFIGKVVTTAGTGILSLWVYYFAGLVRATDYWDLLPLFIALVTIFAGIKLTRLDTPILSKIGVSYKRDIAIALAIGTAVELGLWGFLFPEVVDPETAERHLGLYRLQEPAEKIALATWKHSRLHFGISLNPFLVSIVGLVALITMWSLGALALLLMLRFLQLPNRGRK